MVEELSHGKHARTMIFSQYIKFIDSLVNNKRPSIRSLFKIGRCYQKSNDTKNAIRYFKNVIKKNPDHVKARFQLIKIYEELGRNKDAIKECEIIYMLDRSIHNSTSYCIENSKN